MTWGQLRHITLEPASGRKAPPFLGVDAASDLERYVVWHLRVELNSALAPKDNPFGVFTTAPGKIVRLAPSMTAVNALSFPTQELARTELSRLDAALRSYASRIYEPHDDLAALLNP
ncbi:hypothetical protein GTU99_07445 [Streptomyces sp. PRKS01-65]|nr:hypothetical protein [Streptomyces harenosi]NEY32029.1 hypothetical protein [Streptomyces harenosi]